MLQVEDKTTLEEIIFEARLLLQRERFSRSRRIFGIWNFQSKGNCIWHCGNFIPPTLRMFFIVSAALQSSWNSCNVTCVNWSFTGIPKRINEIIERNLFRPNVNKFEALKLNNLANFDRVAKIYEQSDTYRVDGDVKLFKNLLDVNSWRTFYKEASMRGTRPRNGNGARKPIDNLIKGTTYNVVRVDDTQTSELVCK